MTQNVHAKHAWIFLPLDSIIDLSSLFDRLEMQTVCSKYRLEGPIKYTDFYIDNVMILTFVEICLLARNIPPSPQNPDVVATSPIAFIAFVVIGDIIYCICL